MLNNFRIVTVEIPGGNRNLNTNTNAQQQILNAYILIKQFKFM